MPRHPDFEKIYRAFMKRYCGSPNNECEKGKQVYYAWLNKLGLDDTKPYRIPQEKFQWAKPIFNLIKQDEKAKYYKVEALFPIVSMNRNVYTEEELIRAARTLIGQPVNLNHEVPLEGVEIFDAEYEDGAVEVLLRVENPEIQRMIENGEILHVSIEASCRTTSIQVLDGEVGFGCEGLVFTGLALLTKNVLPGVPLTRIEPVEKIVEGFEVKVLENERKEQARQTCYLCGRPLSDYVNLGRYKVHPQCFKKFWDVAMDVFHFEEKMEYEIGEDKTVEIKVQQEMKGSEKDEQIVEGAIPPHQTPKAPEDREWDADAAVQRIRKWASSDGSGDKDKIDWKKYRQAFAWYNAQDPENFGSYKLPHHDVIDGKLVVVWRGVAAAMAALRGARGGVDIPRSDYDAVYRHLARHYRQFDKELPEECYIEGLETLLRMADMRTEKLQAKIKELAEEKKAVEEKLRKIRRIGRIIVKL